MKWRIPGLRPRRRDPERGLPGYLFGGRIRTTTVVLILAFVVVWWAYAVNRPVPKPAEAPQVVPPGFVPDPNYTWVPRSQLNPPPPATITETITPPPVTETITPAPHHSATVPPPPFPLPPPFGAPPPPAPPTPSPRGAPPGPPTTPSPAR